jgi:hypothetical protein
MMNNSGSLLNRFDALIVEGQERYSSYIRSTDDLRRCLVRVYLWWAESNTQIDVIKAIEDRHGMSVVTMNGNNVVFTNLLRIVFDKTEANNKEYTKVYMWGRALSALHEEYTENPQRYRTNPEGTLLKYFNDKGGISGVMKSASSIDDDNNTPIQKPPPKPPNTTTSAASTAAVQQTATSYVKTAPGIGVANSSAPLRVDAIGHIALLARREKNGQITVLGSSNDANIIASIAQSMLATNTTLLPYSLRLLIEVIRTQAYPPFAMPKQLENRKRWFENVWLDKSFLKTGDFPNAKKGEKSVALWAPKKLLIRGRQKDVILSNSKADVSVVTRFVPLSSFIKKDEEIFLRVVERSKIERLIETAEAHIVDANPKDSLRKTTDGEKATYKLAISNYFAKTNMTLHFYSTKPYAGTLTGFQADFDFKAFKPVWRFDAEHSWFGALRAQMLDEWFANLGSSNQLKRENNRLMELSITPTEVKIAYNMSAYGNAEERVAAKVTMPKDVQCINTLHFSKEIASVLYNLADVLCDGSIQVSGNADAIVFEYKNDIGTFQIAVPSVVKKGKRYIANPKAFYDYRYA